MPKSWWLRSGFVLFLLVASVLMLVPTVVEMVMYPEELDTAESTGGDDVRTPPLPDWYIWYRDHVAERSLALGLDLQGGLLLRYSVDIDTAIDDKLTQFGADMVSRLAEAGVSVSEDILRDEDQLRLTFADEDDADKAQEDEFLRDFPVLTVVGSSGNEVTFGLREGYLTETEEFAVKQAVEIIRERVDSVGVAAPSIRVEGSRNIVVELPGLSSRRAAATERLISTTAVLTFKLVADAEEAVAAFQKFSEQLSADGQVKFEGSTLVAADVLNKDGGIERQGKEYLRDFVVQHEKLIPMARQVVYEKIEQEEGARGPQQWRTRLVRIDLPVLTGDNVVDAYPAANPNTNIPYVSLKLDRQGGDTFFEITKEHVGDQLAILMDDTLISDPVIRSQIPGGNVSIEMGGKDRNQIREDVQNLVVALRSGALPAPIRQEFRTLVGPALGRDSIEKGTWAMLIGLLLVVVSMLVYYRFGGVVANIALVINVTFILAVLAGLGSTLTLPGLAGMVLTIGMAVDANVLIYERIREELRAGETIRKAVQLGYERAFWTILDSQLTTAIAAVVLTQFGSGPVRGFAVTLLIGIVCSVFTAIFVTRLVFDWYLSREKVQSLSL
ncbi:MAG: protein translocase subunit SecD [Myxococcota bacterium]|jgi:protein-export membrane protein SecD|nr:protein translocase subunit SecD [Myxococcota bacterium]